MIAAPSVLQVAAQNVARIRLLAKWSEMPLVMGPGLAELRAAVAAQDIAVTGPWLCHHFRRPTETFDFAICLPVAEPVRPAGRVQPAELPAGTVARTIHHGGYEGLGAAWGEFLTWVQAQNLRVGAEFWECYVVGPDAGVSSEQWRTELSWPLVEG